MHARSTSFILCSLALSACGSDGTSSETDAIADATPDSPSVDVEPDGEADLAGDTDPDSDASVDVDAPSDAEADTPEYSDWDHQTPWVGPDLNWSTCDVEPDGALADKAAYYDWIVPALHQTPATTPGHEDWSRVFGIRCEAAVPTSIVDEDELPFCTHNFSENNGLWTSLYVASQAYRYAATRDPAALEQVVRTLRGTQQMSRITGVPGLYTRDFRDPGIPQQTCHDDPMEYVPPGADMVGNRWVRVGDDGCFLTWDPALNGGDGDWVRDAEHCTSDEFAGFCWQRNVSKDEYSGHFIAATLVAKLVDDPEAQRLASEVLGDATQHLIDSEFWIDDYDGRQTRYGSAHALSLDHLPGFNAFMALSWVREGLSVTKDPAFADIYYGCLLAEREVDDCIDQPFETGADYRSYLTDLALRLGCETNYDNVSMMTLSYLGIMLMEPDPERRAFYRDAFHSNSRGPDSGGRDLWNQGNALLNFVLASMMGPEPDSPDDASALVHDAICSLHGFHANNIQRTVDNSDVDVHCVSNRHGNLASESMPMADRCMATFEWWGDPAQIENCTGDPTSARPPAAYLLPYWMGRYHGFISEEM